MSENEELYCIGCGAKLQSDNEELPGYVPASALKKYTENDESDSLYCKRCFRLRHYNEVSDVSIDNDEFTNLLSKIGSKNALVVNVVDIFNLSGSIIPGLHRFVGDNPILLVGNKADLLPKSFNLNKLKNRLQAGAKQLGLHPIDVELVSSKKLSNIDHLLQKIVKYHHHKDVYVVGTTNVGKSTLINAIIKARSDYKDVITTSSFPGTTLNEIHISLEDGTDLIDTPGIIRDDQISGLLNKKDQKYLSPQSEIHPKIFQLKDQQTLFIGGLARLDFVKGKPGSFIAFVENHLIVHRTKLENADDFYKKQLGNLLTPPQSDEKIPPLVGKTFSTKEQSDIVFSGLGWVVVPANVEVTAYLPKGYSAEIRKSIVY